MGQFYQPAPALYRNIHVASLAWLGRADNMNVVLQFCHRPSHARRVGGYAEMCGGVELAWLGIRLAKTARG